MFLVRQITGTMVPMNKEDYVQHTLRAYDAHPEKYETATAAMAPQEEIQKFIDLLPETDMPILDAGCGFGRDTALFTERGLQSTGIDMSEGLLKRAAELYPQLTFKKMDVRDLDFADNSFVGIWCHATLLHLKDEDVLAALKEFKRVLAPGGILFVSFKEGTGDEEFVEKFSSESSRYFNYQQDKHVEEMIKQSGLNVVNLYLINEREKWGADKRDLNWVYCFAQK